MSEVVGSPEDSDDEEDRKEQEPVHDIDIDLGTEAREKYIRSAVSGMIRVVMPWYTIEKMPEIMACDAMTVAAMLRMQERDVEDGELVRKPSQKGYCVHRDGSGGMHPGQDNS